MVYAFHFRYTSHCTELILIVLGFYINLPCGAVAAIFLLFVTLPHRTLKSVGKHTVLDALRKLDLIGFSLFAPAAIQFIFALEWGGIKYSWNSADVLCGAVV